MEDRPCPSCGKTATVSMQHEEFGYRVGPGDDDVVLLEVEVPVISCKGCGDEFTDWRAEEIRASAVRDMLAKRSVG